MKALKAIGVVAAAAALIAVAAQAQSLKLRQRMVNEDVELVKHADYTNQQCGSSMTVAFDWTGVPEDQLSTYSANGYCDAALEGIRRICGDALGKDAVKKQIKSVTCGFGPARDISVKDGAVSYKINFSSANDADFVYEQLQNKL